MQIKSFIYIILCVTALTAFNGKEEVDRRFISNCDTTNDTFVAGEELTYTVYYNWNFVWVPAGEVVFAVDENPTHYRYKAYGRTFPSYEWFYKVRDRYETVVDKSTLLPMYTIREVHEGEFDRFARAEYDYDNGQIRYQIGESKERLKPVEVMPMQECMHDILSVLYYARNIDYNRARKGDVFPSYIFMDDEDYDVTFKFHGKDNKKIKGLGKFNTIKLIPQLVSSHVFNDGDQMEVWASNDENRIPLLVKSPVSVGSVKMVLKEYRNLKYDLSSQIK